MVAEIQTRLGCRTIIQKVEPPLPYNNVVLVEVAIILQINHRTPTNLAGETNTCTHPVSNLQFACHMHLIMGMQHLLLILGILILVIPL